MISIIARMVRVRNTMTNTLSLGPIAATIKINLITVTIIFVAYLISLVQ